jgi:uncharacterized protein involved in response to NO
VPETRESAIDALVAETERSFPTPPGSRWRTEPFRIFFPLGVALGWIGIGHWLLYAIGAARTYSCTFHGLVQTQAFMMAFALGFLLTALPRRTRGAPPSAAEMAGTIAALVVVTGAALAESMRLQQAAYAAVFLLLGRFAVRRFLGRDASRRPPAAFVLIPIAFAQGLAGATLLGAGAGVSLPPWATTLGLLLVQQGVFLSLTAGVGSLILPLMAGQPPPADLGSSPRERRRALAYAAAGIAIVASLIVEALGAARAGPLVRAAVIAGALGLGGGAWRPPGKPGLHRRLAWVAVWMMPLGLTVSALWPEYRVPALHVLFIGGFALLVFAVASHVILSHLDLERLALGRPPAIIFLAAMLGLALLARVAADWSESYFEHLGWAAACWLAGTAVWLGFIGPKLWRRS